MYDVNVTGTRNVLAACVTHRIPRLVYTSTASVVFAGRDLDGVDEAAPVPPAGAFLDYYTSTKAEAEAAVRAANGVGGVSTVCLRPSGMSSVSSLSFPSGGDGRGVPWVWGMMVTADRNVVTTGRGRAGGGSGHLAAALGWRQRLAVTRGHCRGEAVC